jgi:hypothetical protein
VPIFQHPRPAAAEPVIPSLWTLEKVKLYKARHLVETITETPKGAIITFLKPAFQSAFM